MFEFGPETLSFEALLGGILVLLSSVVVLLYLLIGFINREEVSYLRRKAWEARIEWADKYADARLLPRLRDEDIFPRKDKVLYLLLWPVMASGEIKRLEGEIQHLRS